ncbi:MAG: hypothetical protein QOD76_2088 [Solirubrobacteraceae bacterium]|nr:hypothetical protein [Solirubrobacteraceae bacterium]
MRTGLSALVAVVGAAAAATPAEAIPPPPSSATCAQLRAHRSVPPIQAYDPAPGAPRVFAIQFKQDLRNVQTYEAFRDKIECQIREIVLPRHAVGRPNVVAYNEDIGLMTIATGSRGAQARALFANPKLQPSCESQGAPCGAIAALATLNSSYAPQLAAYHARFPGLNPISGAFVAATDTFVRGFMQTFSDMARRYGIYILGSNDQAAFRESSDPGDIATFRDPDEPAPASVYVATDDSVYNEVFMWGPHDLRSGGPAPLRNMVASNKKVPLTPIEEQFQFTNGPATGPEAIENVRPYRLPGTDARIAFATSLPAFKYGDGAERPAPGHECDDVSRTYMRCLDVLGANLIVQDEANPGRWADNFGCGGTCWQPLEWMTSTWRTAADPTVRFAYNVTPFMVGHLADLTFDGQTAITQRGLHDRSCAYVGNTLFQVGDPERLRVDAGPKPEFLGLVPWVVPDAPRAELRAFAAKLAPGSGDPLDNDYLETAIVADLPFPPDQLRGGCLTAADTAAPSARLSAPAYASDASTSPSIPLAWSGADAGSGVAYFTLEVRRTGNAAAAGWSTPARSAARATRFRGAAGGTYQFRLRSYDRAGNPSAAVVRETVVPLDQTSRRLRYAGAWRTLRRGGAYGGSVARASAGATVRLAFSGRRVALIGRRPRGGGRLLVAIDRRTRVVRLGGRRRPRAVLFASPRLRAGRHALSVTALSARGELDAVAVT